MMWKVVTALMICSILAICLVPTISALKTVKTIDGQLGYIPQTEANQIYENEVTIDPPDGITDVIDAQIIVKGDFQANTKVSAKINDHFCTPTYWQVPNLDAINYQAIFDCSELAENFKGGDMTLSFATDKVAQNVKGTYRMTYYNNPERILNVYGTEYDVSDGTGKVFLQLLDDQKNAIENSTCYANIYYPNATKWEDNILMDYVDDGLYFYDIEIPSITGNYMVSALCSVPEDIEETATDGFESGDLNGGTGWADSGWSTSGDTDIYASTVESYEGSYSMLLEGKYEYGDEEGWSNRTVNITTEEAYVTFYGNFQGVESGEYAEFWVTDASGSQTRLLRLDNGDDDGDWHYYSYTLEEPAYDLDGTIELGYYVSVDYHNDEWYIDNVRVLFNSTQNQTDYVYVRGSGELHVTDRFRNLSAKIGNVTQNELVEKIWNYSNRSASANWYELIVSGTEYNSGEEGTLYTQFLKTSGGTGQPINDGTCNITLYYPNGSVFANSLMAYISGSNGMYSYNFTVPETEGTYGADSKCIRGGVKAYSSNTFHTGEWANKVGQILDNQTTIYNYLVAHNQSVHQKLIFLENLMESINGSLWNKLFNIQDELANITSTLELVRTDIVSTNSSLHSHLDNINSSIYDKLLYIEQLIENIDFNTTDLENLILNLNTTLHNHLDANNLTVMTKMYGVQAELQDILNNQDNMLNNQTTLYNYLSQVNQSLWEQINTIETANLSTVLDNQQLLLNNQTTIYNYLNQMNQSLADDISEVYNLLSYVNNSIGNIQTNIQTILANQNSILANQTTIYQKLGDLEVGIGDILSNQTTLYNYMVSHNTSVWNKLFAVQGELADILNNQTTIYDYLVAHNQTVLNQLYQLNADITNVLDNQTTIYNYLLDFNQSVSELILNIDVNTTELENLINNMNQTIMNKLYGVQDELAQILANQTVLKQILYSHNQTIYDKLTEISNDLTTINNNIDLTNQTIMNKLYGVQDELANITNLTQTAIDLIYDTNETIMTYLYKMNNSMWEGIYNIWENIANVTNISLEITANLSDLPKETYLYFQTVEERLVHNNDFCVNNTHRKELLVEKCVAGDCYNITKNIDEVCPYGCNQGACNPYPQVKYGIFITAILLMLGFMFMIYQIARRT